MAGPALDKPKYEVAVVVPVYKPHISACEKVAYERCLSVLGEHDIVLVAPEGLGLDAYSPYGKVRRFDASFFEDVGNYNRLMLSKEFYRSFLDYRYILMYQLDAFVFSDELLRWCAQGYDYIGAPWPDGVNLRPFPFRGARVLHSVFPFWNKEITYFVGNGGFSLRNVRSCIRLLDRLPLIAKLWNRNEDFFFAIHGLRQSWFRIPDWDVAQQFSVEKNPRGCYRNQQRLPFGCHGWRKWDIEFWRPIFRDLGYII